MNEKQAEQVPPNFFLILCLLLEWVVCVHKTKLQ